MPYQTAPLYALNAGVVGDEALARTDLAKMRLAASEQVNLLPRVLGPAIFRPGTEFIGSSAGGNPTRLLRFVFNASTTALLELTNLQMRVWLDGEVLSRPAVTAAVANGDFASDLSGWTGSDESGATSDWAGGNLRLTGTGTNYAIRQQQVVVAQAGVEHALRIRVISGYVTFRLGSFAGADDYVAETVLRPGYHSLSFTPSGNFHIWVGANTEYSSQVGSINVEAPGPVILTTPWSGETMRAVRYDQSGDVLFCACDGVRQQRIERRSQRSWSIVDYRPDNGPFRLPNFSQTTITPSALSGSCVLTASRGIFKPKHVGALFQLTHSGQGAEDDLAGDDQYSGYIRVSGLADFRQFGIVVEGAWSGTVTLQRSFGEPGSWVDVESYTSNVVKAYSDELDNQIIYYRLGIKTGNYVSGSAKCFLSFTSSVQTGVCRVSGYSSPTSVTANILSDFAASEATSNWSEGEWSDHRGYPSSVAFHDGRLFWAGNDRVFGSVSDAYESFDEAFEGDAGPILRSVTTGGVEGIYWLLSLQRLLAGTSGQEVSIRSSSFDEPLTPTAFTARACSNRGNANLQAVAIDSTAIFVQRNAKRVFELLNSVEAGDYKSGDLTRLAPEICAAGVVAMAVQRQPDTRVWFVLTDGTCAVLTYEREDDVIAWTPVQTTNGAFRDVCVLPGDDEDQVYFVVSRTINSVVTHYVERLAKVSEVSGGPLNKTVDCHFIYSGVPTATISGLGHLEGQDVVVWADGGPVVTNDAPIKVVAGAIVLPTTVSNAVIGLAYTGRFKSAKLAYGSAFGTAMTFPKRISKASLIMANVGWKGVRIGRNFTAMTGLPATLRGRPLAPKQVIEHYDFDGAPFNGGWDTDSRLCFQVTSPYPATFLGAVIGIETNERHLPQDRSPRDAG